MLKIILQFPSDILFSLNLLRPASENLQKLIKQVALCAMWPSSTAQQLGAWPAPVGCMFPDRPHVFGQQSASDWFFGGIAAAPLTQVA